MAARETFLITGANGFIEKPFDRSMLLATIEQILEGSLSRSETDRQ